MGGKFPLVLFDNRDEIFDRPTAAAEWWPEHPSIYAPRDLAKTEMGTWIGVSKNGRVAVLVNKFQTAQEANTHNAKLSRGALPKQYLLSQLSPSEWVRAIKSQHKDALSDCGDFTMLVATIDPTTLEPEIKFLSNCDNEIESSDSGITMSLSNGMYGDSSWEKVHLAEQEFSKLSDLESLSMDRLIAEGFRILSTPRDPPPKSREELRKSIFIPPLRLDDKTGYYGTRTQTAIIFEGQLVTYIEIDVVNDRAYKIEKFKIEV